MARIAGVKTVKNTKGDITHITVDVRKHPEVATSLQQLGLMEKTQFEKDCENATPVKEAFQKVYDHINSLKWQK